MTTFRRTIFRFLVLSPAPLLALAAGGCVQRTLQIESNPPGALVYLNGDEVGRTPMRKNFVWYGTYDVQLRKEGYQTLSRKTRVWAPWWQIPPIDLLAELVPLPLEDKQYARYDLKPVTNRQTDPQEILGRAVSMRRRLKSSRFPQPAKEEKDDDEAQPAGAQSASRQSSVD
jgi:hypothetical protein